MTTETGTTDTERVVRPSAWLNAPQRPYSSAPTPRVRPPEDVLATVHMAEKAPLDAVERQAWIAETEARTLDSLRIKCLSRIADTVGSEIASLDVHRAIERGRARARRDAADALKQEIKGGCGND